MRRRLALLAAAITSLVLVAFLVPLALLVRTVAADRALDAAISQLQSLTSAVATATSTDALRLTVEQVNATAEHPVTVLLGDGTVLGAPVARTPAVELAARGRSLSVDVPAGQQILVSVQGAPTGPAVIATVVPKSDLRRGVTTIWLILLGLGIMLVAVGVVVADRLAVSMVGPITEAARVSHRLARGDLEARARAAAGPPEIRDVATALNHLASRIRELLRAERETAADLSHRLRTPLTALRLDAESLRDPQEAERIGSDLDALERAVDQAIRDARRSESASADTPGSSPRTCDAAAVVRDRVEFWSALADDTDRTVELDLPGLHDGPICVALPAADLAAVADAVLGNVFAHTPDGTPFAVQLSARPSGGARLVVRDAGPGLSSSSGDPTTRGASGAGSTGLGLDIVRRAANASGGTLRLSEAPAGGAEITIDLGPPRRHDADMTAATASLWPLRPARPARPARPR
ncbi:sensor histidine kinase [Actinopolymorpha singaporensis]|uniref:histidine kinase n=1 Tax=Actinopolymorpha singaporensis TaxID=117157 RepID=A0A1H1TWD1_9ACTN|nr:HAMP domain-containing sensor histidine kinase [Actinopolymorpha singaporensis]SDS64557.1 Signal transduction histidine kinase [Actinopolymorpha singaporensis]